MANKRTYSTVLQSEVSTFKATWDSCGLGEKNFQKSQAQDLPHFCEGTMWLGYRDPSSKRWCDDTVSVQSSSGCWRSTSVQITMSAHKVLAIKGSLVWCHVITIDFFPTCFSHKLKEPEATWREERAKSPPLLWWVPKSTHVAFSWWENNSSTLEFMRLANSEVSMSNSNKKFSNYCLSTYSFRKREKTYF